MEGLSLTENTWKNFMEWPTGRHGAGLVTLNNKLYLSCGKRAKKTGTDIGDLWVLSED